MALSFYHQDPPTSTVAARRRLCEVAHPSQKVIVNCQAISDQKQISGTSFNGEAHGYQATTWLFVDGHAHFLHWRQLISDPWQTEPGWNWSGLDWADSL